MRMIGFMAGVLLCGAWAAAPASAQENGLWGVYEQQFKGAKSPSQNQLSAWM
jgi:hypothetical protein